MSETNFQLEDIEVEMDLEQLELEKQNAEREEFEDRVSRLVQMMKDDETVPLRCLAEMYVFMTDMEQAMRTMQLNGGPIKMLKAMMGRG